jgi:hypothetical protein
MAGRVLEDVVGAVRARLGCLYRLAECTALLDLLMSFAGFVSLHDNWGIVAVAPAATRAAALTHGSAARAD